MMRTPRRLMIVKNTGTGEAAGSRPELLYNVIAGQPRQAVQRTRLKRGALVLRRMIDAAEHFRRPGEEQPASALALLNHRQQRLDALHHRAEHGRIAEQIAID